MNKTAALLEVGYEASQIAACRRNQGDYCPCEMNGPQPAAQCGPLVQPLPVPRVPEVERLGHALAALPQIECPLVHRFAPGIYLRQITMPADTIVIGKRHLTEHFNILLSGRCILRDAEGNCEEIVAPHVFVSGIGVQKVLIIVDETVWLTVHPTDDTDISRLENTLVEAPPSPLIEDSPPCLLLGSPLEQP